MANVYFELTRELNTPTPVAMLCSGQAAVYYRIAMMSKDGDWVLRETAEACARTLEVLSSHDARYRPAAPLDLRWLRGGWSSHFQFFDERRRRIRCDFFTRPPRLDPGEFNDKFAHASSGELLVIDRLSLIQTKQTQRAKDYPVIGELARSLPPEIELATTTDPDRILALAPEFGDLVTRKVVDIARRGGSRDQVVVALALETDRRQVLDRQRLEVFERASREFLEAFRKEGIDRLPLGQAHRRCVELAELTLPRKPKVRTQ